MSDAQEHSSETQVGQLPPEGHPGIGLPNLYADGVTSLSPGQEVVKFYLSRIEPNFIVNKESKVLPIAQVVMPLSGFIQMVLFFQNTLDDLIGSGSLKKEVIDSIRDRARMK